MFDKVFRMAVVCGLLPTMALGISISDQPASVWALFPRDSQGENGIRLQDRAVGTSDYNDLEYEGPYLWRTLDAPYMVPFAIRHVPEMIFAHPGAVVSTGADLDAIIRVGLEGTLPAVRITGWCESDGFQNGSTGYSYYIYKGATNWANPIWQWQADPNQTMSFDLIIPFATGNELFFGTSSGVNSYSDWAKWHDIRLTGVPEPTTLGLLLGGALWCSLGFKSRSRMSRRGVQGMGKR